MKSCILCVALTKDNKYILTANEDFEISFWNFEKITEEFIIKAHEDTITSICICDNFFASGSEDSTVRIWNSDKKTQEKALKGHSSGVTTLTIIENQKFVISGSRDMTIIV